MSLHDPERNVCVCTVFPVLFLIFEINPHDRILLDSLASSFFSFSFFFPFFSPLISSMKFARLLFPLFKSLHVLTHSLTLVNRFGSEGTEGRGGRGGGWSCEGVVRWDGSWSGQGGNGIYPRDLLPHVRIPIREGSRGEGRGGVRERKSLGGLVGGKGSGEGNAISVRNKWITYIRVRGDKRRASATTRAR